MIRFVFVLVLCSQCLPTAFSQSDFLLLLDSLYTTKDYPQLIEKAHLYLEKNEVDPYAETYIQYNLSNAYYKSGDFVKCWEYIVQANTTAQEIELTDTAAAQIYVDVSQRLGDYSFQAEEPSLGIEALQNGISVAESKLSNDAWRLGKLYHKAGALYRFKTQFAKSIDYLKRGQIYLSDLEENRRNYLSTVFLAEMAQVYNDNNQLNKSIKIFKEILESAYKDGNKKRQSIYNNNISIAYRRKGDLGKAEYHMRKSLEAELELYNEQSPKVISSYANLAHINGALGRYQEANKYYDKLDTLIALVFDENHSKNGDTHFNRGSNYYDQQKYYLALKHFKESTRIRAIHKDENDLILAESEYMLAATLNALGRYEEALPILHKVLKSRKEGITSQDTERSKILTSLHETYRALGNEILASQYLNESFDALDYNLEQPYLFDQVENPQALIDPLALKLKQYADSINSVPSDSILTNVYRLIDNADSLIQYLKLRYDDIASRKNVTAQSQILNEAMIECLYAAYKQSNEYRHIEKVFEIFEKGNNNFLYEAIAEENSINVFGIPQELMNKKLTIQDSITILHQEIHSIPLSERIESKKHAQALTKINVLKQDLYNILQRIKLDYPKYFKTIYKTKIASIEEIKQSLDKNEVIITYFLGNENTYGLLLSKNNEHLLQLKDSPTIENKISSLLEVLKDRSTSNIYLQLSKDLYRILIQPFEINTMQKINIVADDALGLLPFEVLINEESNLPLVLTHNISYHYSNTFKLASGIKPKGKSSLAMAPIFRFQEQNSGSSAISHYDSYRSELDHLPETEDEVKMVSQMFKGEAKLGSEASESEFKALANDKALLHLATHGIMDNDNPDFSRLYFNTSNDTLEDGMLHAHEIVNLNLTADLVSLSACNTGAGKIQNGEGISSLGRAFAYANCPNQLISLWPANDKSTTQLMKLYYTNLKEGMGKSEALTSAKRKYLASSPDLYKHPHYWAGFVYYGQDTKLKLGSSIHYSYWIGFGILGLFFGYYFLRRKKNRIDAQSLI